MVPAVAGSNPVGHPRSPSSRRAGSGRDGLQRGYTAHIGPSSRAVILPGIEQPPALFPLSWVPAVRLDGWGLDQGTGVPPAPSTAVRPRRAGILPATIEHLWSTNGIVSEDSTAGKFLAALFGCSSRPSLLQLVVWLGFVGTVVTAFLRRTNVDSAIQADGSILGQAPGITLVGKRAGMRIEGDITNGACGLHFTLVKKDN